MQAIIGKSEKPWLYRGLKSILSSPELIRNRVARAQAVCGRSSDKRSIKDKTAHYLIRERTKPSIVVGVLTGAVGLIPIVGQVGAVAAALTAEFIAVTEQEIELCLEIAHNYGHDIADERKRMLEILAILGREKDIREADASSTVAVTKAVNKIMGRYARLGFLRALNRAAMRIQLRTGLRAITKIIPVLGMGLGGFANYLVVRKTGLLAMHYYKRP